MTGGVGENAPRVERPSFAAEAGSKFKTHEQDDPFLDFSNAGKKVPILGSGYSTVNAIAGAEDIKSGAALLVTKGANFAASCAGEVVSFAMDPINWLVSNGLNFLIELIRPLQDLLHMATGDGPALSEAAGNFKEIGSGMETMGQELLKDRDLQLQNWTEDAGTAAKTKLEELSKGIEGVAGTAHGVADTLTMWSMVMQILEDVIKAIISELVSWAIYTWLPALASSVVSFGASVAAAMAATVGKVASALGRILKKVGKVSKLLDEFAEFLLKWGKRLEGFRDAFKAYKAAGVNPLELSSKARKMSEMGLKQAGLHALKEGGKQAVSSVTGYSPGGTSSTTGKVKTVTGVADKAYDQYKKIDDVAFDGKDTKYTREETERNLDV